MPILNISSAVTLELETFVYTKALLTANSGGGKSYLIRKMAEQVAQHMPVIIFDWEGEFFTLRERYDIFVVGDSGEIRADVKTSQLLARRLIEKNVSAVLDLSTMDHANRRTFVRRFCEALLLLPRSAWRPVVLFVDEAHMLCPERSAGDAESREAIINLMSQGRKRGLCGVLATQRISKLHKDAVAECNNIFIGRTALDIDRKRAADILGISIKDAGALSRLAPGTWCGYGPAFVGVNEVTEFKILPPVTTHLSPAQRAVAKLPAPSAAMAKHLREFADLAKEADNDARTLEAAQKTICALQKQLAAVSKPAAPQIQKVTVEVPIIPESVVTAFAALTEHLTTLDKSVAAFRGAVTTAAQTLKSVKTITPRTITAPPAVSVVPAPARALPRVREVSTSDLELKAVHRALLTILAQHPEGMPKGTALLFVGYANSGPTSKAWASLAAHGYITTAANGVKITEAGLAALGPFDPIATGRDRLAELLAHNSHLSTVERALLRCVADAGVVGITKGAALTATGYANSGPTSKAWARLTRFGYVVLRNNGVGRVVTLSDALQG